MVHMHYRGHGRSQIPEDQGNLTIQDIARDLAAVLDDDGVGQGILIGHSMGVQVIFEFAKMFPDRVAGLIPMCGSYGRPLTTFNGSDLLDKIFPLLYYPLVLAPWTMTPVWKYLTPTELGYFVAKMTEVNRHLVKREDFMPYLEDISTVPVRIFVKMLDHAARHTAENDLPDLRVPTLIIAGEHDGFTPGWLSERMRDLIPGAELLVIPKGTHTAPLEMPDLINLRIEKWLWQHFGQPMLVENASAESRRDENARFESA
ncbi:MAG: alpha/beta hydrolase [Deltaproteobacteria bacterium]|nr:alpha/beta hydrolase [Deltaproteobacteria bacterium]